MDAISIIYDLLDQNIITIEEAFILLHYQVENISYHNMEYNNKKILNYNIPFKSKSYNSTFDNNEFTWYTTITDIN